MDTANQRAGGDCSELQKKKLNALKSLDRAQNRTALVGWPNGLAHGRYLD
jgi:hypothetical protein